MLNAPACKRILVIRLGALGDLVFCFQAFHEIRAAHPDAEIALLVRPTFAAFARLLPWFDKIILDEHPNGALAWLKLRRAIKQFAPDRVYDLQGKARQTILYSLLGGPCGPEWSGAAPVCEFPRPWPPARDMSFPDFIAAQLRVAGVKEMPPADLSWFDASVEKFALPENYIVLIPGCSPDAPYKRWPAKYYADLATKLRARGRVCVVVGAAGDADTIAEIKRLTPDVIDLCGQTSLLELAGILRCAAGAIGNDTGPTHLAAKIGVPTLALFSGRSSAIWSKPPGLRVAVMQKKDLADLSVDAVLTAFDIL